MSPDSPKKALRDEQDVTMADLSGTAVAPLGDGYGVVRGVHRL